MRRHHMLRRLSLALRIILTYKNAYRFFLQRLGRPCSETYTIYELWNGMKYKCRNDATDFTILNEIAIFKVYFKYNFDRIDDTSIVLDFGGQAGSFAIYTAYTTGATVLSFEPERENFQLLCENIALNQLEHRVIAINKAVSRTGSPRTFYLSPHDNKGVHSFFYKGERAVMVECIEIDKVLDLIGDRRIDLLKIDVEGAEHEIVTPEQRIFFDRVQNMVLEYHCSDRVDNHRSLESLADAIQKFGFTVKVEGGPENGIIYAASIK
jgi:FkbM family methyltransferase